MCRYLATILVKSASASELLGGQLGLNDRAKGSVRGAEFKGNLANDRVFGGVVANPSRPARVGTVHFVVGYL